MDESNAQEINNNAAPKVDDAAKEIAEETPKDAVMKDTCTPSATSVTSTVDAQAPASAGTKRDASDPVEEEEPPKKKPALEPANNDKEASPAMPNDSTADKASISEPTNATATDATEKDAAATATEAPAETSSSAQAPSEVPAAAGKPKDPVTTEAPPKPTAPAATTTSSSPVPAPVPAAPTAKKAAEKTQERPAPASTKPAPAAKSATTGRKKEPTPSATTAATAKPTTSKKAAAEPPKALKGLRHFSMMVCKKVEEKGQTTYNEVADELVSQVIESRKREDPQGKFDEKNIRRRVYDSINVLLAMDIISKDKKQISWKGLPTMAHHDIQLLEREEQARKEQVQAKRLALQELLVQQICFRNLVRRNKKREIETLHAEKVPMPFLVVNTHKKAIVNCNMAPDMKHAMFEFDHSFEINDDNSILKRLGMHRTTVPELKQIVPEDMITYCQEHGLLDDSLGDSSEDADTPQGLTSVGSNRGQYFQSLD